MGLQRVWRRVTPLLAFSKLTILLHGLSKSSDKGHLAFCWLYKNNYLLLNNKNSPSQVIYAEDIKIVQKLLSQLSDVALEAIQSFYFVEIYVDMLKRLTILYWNPKLKQNILNALINFCAFQTSWLTDNVSQEFQHCFSFIIWTQHGDG